MSAPQQTDPWVSLKNAVEQLTEAVELLTSVVKDVEARVRQLERRQAPNERIIYDTPPAITQAKGYPDDTRYS